MNRLLIIAALFVAPVDILLTLDADKRMSCELVHADQRGLSIPYCVRPMGTTVSRIGDVWSTTRVEIGLYYELDE